MADRSYWLRALRHREEFLTEQLRQLRMEIDNLERELSGAQYDSVDTGMRIFGVPVYEEVRRS